MTLSSVLSAQSTHQVQSGETLYSISRRYKVPIDALVAANSIVNPQNIQPGIQLLIPSETIYQVQPGDTLYSIAHTHRTTVEVLQDINKLSDTIISVGSVLQLPVKDAAFSLQTSAAAPPSPSDLSWPVKGSRKPLTGKFPGIAISAEEDSPVQAVRGGRVIYAGPHSSFGSVVFVQSPGGYVYVYAGQKTLSVEVGQEVSFEQEVGRLGVTAISPSAQLYFSVWKNNRFISPEQAPRG